MKKGFSTAFVVLCVGVAMTLVGSILRGFAGAISTSNFNMEPLAVAMLLLGVLAVVLSGVVLTAIGAVRALKEEK